MRTQFIILIFISLFTSIATMAQKDGTLTQNINGIVYDAGSRTPLPYVSISLVENPSIGTTSDENGIFIIKNVPLGRHSVQATFVGYEKAIYREILLTSSKEVTLEILLKESVTEIEEVNVRPQLNKEGSMNNMATTGAKTLSVEDASRYAGGLDDPARLVSSFAGVSPAVSSNGISIHGNAPHLLQWKLEDVEIPNPNHFADISVLGGGILSSLSSMVLGNSDFFTGAFPAEYSNAVSGVFDMKLRNGNNQKHENTFQFGILGIDFGSEGPFSKKGNSSYIFNYRYSTTGLMSKASGQDLGGVMDYQDWNFKMNFPTKKAGTFSVWGTGLIDKYEDELEKNTSKWKYNGDRSESNSKQYMASGGISHRYYFKNESVLKTSVAGTYYDLNGEGFMYDTLLNRTPMLDLNTTTTNLIFTTSYNKKFSPRFTNKTGFTFTHMIYKMNLDVAPFEGEAMERISEGDGSANLLAFYNSSNYNISDRFSLNLGVNAQLLTLNNSWTVEPRVGMKWQATRNSNFAFAYGLHSRMEKMDVYYVKTKDTKDNTVNNKLEFTKSHHFMLSYGYRFNDDLHLKIEPYYQYLYDVPVIADSSFSILNRDEFYVEDALVNKGKGRNYGVDLTLEKYMSKGFYYLITASVFDSKYRGGNGEWYNTKFNRNFIINGLYGKEWMVGKNKQNIFSASLKLTLQGGERYSPVDERATFADPDLTVHYDENKAYSKQFSPMFTANTTVSYKINRKKVAHEFAVKLLNLNGSKEYYGHDYNFKKNIIEPSRGSVAIYNVSYKLEF